jgi:hypothetical protein
VLYLDGFAPWRMPCTGALKGLPVGAIEVIVFVTVFCTVILEMDAMALVRPRWAFSQR